jgi:hypothetical protein
MGHDVNAARLKSHLLNEVAEIHDAEAAGHVSGAVAQAIHRVPGSFLVYPTTTDSSALDMQTGANANCRLTGCYG